MVAMKRTIKLFYLAYTGYIILVCMISDLSFIKISISLMLLWLLYFVFCIGTGNKTDYQTQCIENKNFFILSASKKKLFAVGILILLCSFLTAHFYTGMWPDDVISVYRRGGSTYQIYQKYFATSALGTLSITKIPFVAMMVIQKIAFYYSFVILAMNGVILNERYRLYLFLLMVAQVYFGLARGTNFEMYQLFITIVYCYVVYHEAKKKPINIAMLVLLGLGMVSFFLLIIHFRGHSVFALRKISSVISFKENSLIVTNIPILATCVAWVFSYLGFGLFYIATMVFDVMSNSVMGMVDIFVPILNSREQTNILTDIGVQWAPDFALLLDKYGIIVAYIIVFFMGFALRYSNKIRGGEIYYNVLCYIMFVEMLSLPVGNFLAFSSEKLTILFTVFMLLLGHKIYVGRNADSICRMRQCRKKTEL